MPDSSSARGAYSSAVALGGAKKALMRSMVVAISVGARWRRVGVASVCLRAGRNKS